MPTSTSKQREHKRRKAANSALKQRTCAEGESAEDLDDKVSETLEITSMGKPFKKHKFNVSSRDARTVDGYTFDSKWEMQVYQILKANIPDAHLHLQPKFTLQDKFKGPDGKMQRAITYVGDFLIGPARTGDSEPLTDAHILVDCKGMETDVFKLKHKLFMHAYGVMIDRPRTGQTSKIYDLIEAYKRVNKP